MASVVDICNIALGLLGDEATVTNLDPPEGSAQADHCARFFPVALGYMLEQRPWSFAIRRVTLAQLAEDVDPAGWLFAYSHPSDCARVLSVTAPDDKYYQCPKDFIVEANPRREGARIILTDQEQAVCRYVHNCDGIEMFPEQFSQALATYLAFLLAGPLLAGQTGMTVAQKMLQLHQVALTKAMEFDAQQSRHAYDAKARQFNRYYRGARHHHHA